MKFRLLLCTFFAAKTLAAADIDREPLSYATIPQNVYRVQRNDTSLLDWIDSRPELSTLAQYINQSAGFAEAFDTPPQWTYTFFAPSNTAFNQTGSYFETFYKTAKGKPWFGNILQHHYVPNTIFNSTSFNSTLQRLQTSSYMYVSVQKNSDGVVHLNGDATITQGDFKVDNGNGVVHIVDRILGPSYMLYHADIQKIPQGFIAGSCSNTALPYC